MIIITPVFCNNSPLSQKGGVAVLCPVAVLGNIRKRMNKKSGRKKPRLLDYDHNTTIVKPAPDSISTSTPKTDITLSPLGLSLSTTSNISKTGTRRLSLNKSRKLSFDNIVDCLVKITTTLKKQRQIRKLQPHYETR